MEEIQLHSFTFPLLIIISLFFFLSITKWFNKLLPSTNKKNLPPSPRKLPIIGNLHQLGPLPHQDFHFLARKHGPVMLLHFGSGPVVVVSSAETAREIMKTHDLTFVNRPHYSVQKKLFYDGKDVSFAPYGEFWRQLKSILVVHLLSNKMVQSFRSVRKDETALFVEKIREYSSSLEKNVVNLSEMFSELTNDGICRSAFGRKYGDSENGGKSMSLLAEFLELLGIISIGDIFPWLGWISRVNGLDKRVRRVAKELDDFLEGLIRERMEKPEGGKNGGNFIDIVLEIFNDKASGFSVDRDSIKALILDVYAGGTDTTATVLEWAMAELLRHPRVMENLQKEVREIVKGKNDITDEDLEKMHYMKAVIKETLRLHPPSPLLVPRVADKDVKIKGYDVSKGTIVMVNAWAIGRDPQSWDEPEKFEPERFLKNSKNENVDFKGLDFELIPFGAGRRGCPGISFAVATIEFVLANIVHKFNWELPDGLHGKDLDVSEKAGVTIHKANPLLAVANRTK
ncbi:hypothetical protein ABFS82_04G175700 [Erythranthe guttata]|nr:PREDICTED: cytochrome P450 71A8-like [Erythranthe guttata]|eukprot:XP_012829235.1 PREDICTED: cytochrome P450 71A8-like [Erythranthe guttata]